MYKTFICKECGELIEYYEYENNKKEMIVCDRCLKDGKEEND